MTHIYTNENLEKEYNLVCKYLAKKAFYKRYPTEYLEELAPLIEKYYLSQRFNPNVELLNDKDIIEAYDIAKEAHKLQQRSYTHSAYIIHPMEIASYLSSISHVTKDEVIAALLHDVVEDCGFSLKELGQNFGEKVEHHITYLTDIATKEDGNRDKRTALNFEHFKKSIDETKNIKALDIISNSRTILICDSRFSVDYIKPLAYMNHYFQEHNAVDSSVKELLTTMITLGQEIQLVHQKHNILKLDKKKGHDGDFIYDEPVKKLHFS